MRLDKLQVYSSLFDMLRIPQKNRLEIYDCFWRFDKDGSGSIDFREFANSFEIQKTAFAKRAFMMLDTGGTGEINFAQFVVACWNYCTYDKVGLASFAYFLYDPQRKGAIEIPEMFASNLSRRRSPCARGPPGPGSEPVFAIRRAGLTWANRTE